MLFKACNKRRKYKPQRRRGHRATPIPKRFYHEEPPPSLKNIHHEAHEEHEATPKNHPGRNILLKNRFSIFKNLQKHLFYKNFLNKFSFRCGCGVGLRVLRELRGKIF